MRTVKMERVCVYHMLVLPHNASRIPGVHISHSRRAQQVVRAYRHDARLQGRTLTVMCLSNTDLPHACLACCMCLPPKAIDRELALSIKNL